MRSIWSIALIGCICAVPSSMGSAVAQTQTGTTTTTITPRPRSTAPTGMPSMDGRDADTIADPTSTLMEARRVRTLAADRQKKIVDETARLVQLAGEIKAEMEKAGKNETSVDVVRKTEEIERLARDVKQRMKG